MQDSNDLKDRIKNKRKELGLTQRELASLISVSPQVVSNWERGYTPEIGTEDLTRLAVALNTTANFLLGLDSKTKDSNLEKDIVDPTDDVDNIPEYIELNRMLRKMPKKDIKELLTFAKVREQSKDLDDDDDF